MANGDSVKRKPRIRKSAPTVREQIATAQEKPEIKKARLPRLRIFNKLSPWLAPLKRILSKITPRYFTNSWREVRQVTWPSRKETWRLTIAVFVFAIVFGALVAGVDKGLDEVFKHVVLK